MSVCPSCGKPTFQKLLSAAGFQLKGSGWYVTDYGRRDSGAKDSKGETKSESKSEAKSEAKSETKKESSAGAADRKTTKAKEAAAA